MTPINRDTAAAIALLVFCGVFFAQTFVIRDMGYATIGAEVWPRLILAVITGLSLLYLRNSLRQGADEDAPGGGFRGWLERYRSALWCYALFAAFLLTLPYLGMLIGGTGFVFLVLTVLGEKDLKHHLQHAAIAVIAIGFMWLVFTFGLNVILPEGEILRVW